MIRILLTVLAVAGFVRYADATTTVLTPGDYTKLQGEYRAGDKALQDRIDALDKRLKVIEGAPVPPPPPAPPPAPPPVVTPPVTGTGWIQVPGSTLRPALATTGDRGTVGPQSVLSAWNNIVFDGSCLYAHGGGHADYGGNEAYRACAPAFKWERLTEPSPYPVRQPGSDIALTCPYPVSGPPSTHTYDGKVWSSALKRLLVFPAGIAFCPSGVGERGGDGLIWAFDPVTKSWQSKGAAPYRAWATAELPNGNIILVGSDRASVFDPRTMAVVQTQFLPGGADFGDSSAAYDPKRNTVWTVNRTALMRVNLTADFRFAGEWEAVLDGRRGEQPHPGGVGFDGSMVVDPVSGRLLRWGGKRSVIAVTPETKTSAVYEFATGPDGPGPLYDRMFALPDGSFIAVSNNIDEGVWLLKLAQTGGDALPAKTLQQQINEGARSFLAGRYSDGAVITRGGDYDFSGVIPGVAQGKAGVVVQTSEPVIIRNLKVSGLRGGGNVAGIKAEGVNFNVTVQGAHITDCEMGILTDNRGGKLVVESSIVEKNGRLDGDKGHGIYAGEIDELVVRGSRVMESRNFGHLIKSRARKTLIEGNIVAQLGANGSRLIDFSAGGVNTVRNNIFEQGPNTDNAEMIGFALELTSRQWPEQSSLVEGNTFISDVTRRPQSSVVSPFKARTEPRPDNTGFVAPAHQVTANGNRLVSANGAELKMNLSIYTPTLIANGNLEFTGRAAAGLQPYPSLE